ncbi:MAG: hypothetical protein ACW986_05710 [Promethearchaeota archaeon]|jgi:hypothetical protein
MRPSRVFRFLVRIFIYLLTFSVAIVSILGVLSAGLILINPQNIQPDFGNTEFNLEINNTTLAIENINFTLPVNLTNAGYFDMDNLEINLQIGLNYSHINWTTPGVNETRLVRILDHTQNFGTIIKGATANILFTGSNSTFMHGNFPDLLTEVNWFRGPPPLEFYANFTVSLDYAVQLYSISITLLNLPIGGFP